MDVRTPLIRNKTRADLAAALVAFCLAGSPASAADNVYKSVDEEGNVAYQDQRAAGRGGNPELSTEAVNADPASDPSEVDVILYSVETCAACDLMRQLLRELDISFSERRVDEDAAARSRVEELTGTLSVPVLTIGREVVTEYNKDLILTELDKAGLYDKATASVGNGQARGNRGLTREELEQMTPEERQQAARDEALQGIDNDLFDEDEGFLINEDIFPDTRGTVSSRGGRDADGKDDRARN